MNPAFIILVILGMIVLWFLLNGIFKAIGSLVWNIGKETKDNLTEKQEEE